MRFALWLKPVFAVSYEDGKLVSIEFIMASPFKGFLFYLVVVVF